MSAVSIRQSSRVKLIVLDRELNFAAAQAMGGFFHFVVMLRNANQISLVAASSLGKCPLLRMLLLTGAAKAKNGITCSQLHPELCAKVGKRSPQGPFSKSLSACGAASR